MPEFLGKNKADYIQKALSISQDQNKLSNIRRTLREKALKSPLFDCSSFGYDFSNMLNETWNNYSK